MKDTIKAVAPLLAGAVRSGQMFRPQAKVTQPLADIHALYDVEVPLSDGTTVLINVFLSKQAHENGDALPVIMCAHPYDNHNIADLKGGNGAPSQYRLIPQSGRPTFSTQTSWESPDPNFWIPNGYIVVNMNLPGFGGSSGQPGAFRYNQSKAYYEAIEWVAAQSWCDGNVGLNGVSFLAITQYHVAATKDYGFKAPPALKCISPWEGLTDAYRDLFCNGGTPQVGFPAFWWPLEVKGSITDGRIDDFLSREGGEPSQWAEQNPLFNEFWQEKQAPLEKISVPILTCASFSDVGLHSGSAYRGFTDVASQHRWMVMHRDGKWDSYYGDQVQALTLKFMDRFLKGKDNGMDQVPPVQLEVRSDRTTVQKIRHENEWPIARTQYQRWYLQQDGNLSLDNPRFESVSEHDGIKGETRFCWTFDNETELTGHAKLVVYVSLPQGAKSDDLDLFVVLDKLDVASKRVPFNGTVGNHHDCLSRAYQRASLRKLDPQRSTDLIPYLAFDEHQYLQGGKVVELTIPFPPLSVLFAQGESLELTLAAYEKHQSRPFYKRPNANIGDRHRVHVGGNTASYLQVPILED